MVTLCGFFFQEMAAGVGAIPVLAILEQWKTLDEYRTYFKVPDDIWQKFTTAIGETGFDDVQLFSAVSDADFEAGREGCEAPGLRKAALNLVLTAVKVRYGLECGVMKVAKTTTATAAQQQQPATDGSPGASGSDSAVGGPSLIARVKLGQVISQSFDQEIPL